MREAGLPGLHRRRRGRTTISVQGVRTAPDLVERDFNATMPDIVVELSDEHVTAESALARSILEWHYRDAARLSGQLYQLTSDRGGGLVVPRRRSPRPSRRRTFERCCAGILG